jgi:hypothetical protein
MRFQASHVLAVDADGVLGNAQATRVGGQLIAAGALGAQTAVVGRRLCVTVDVVDLLGDVAHDDTLTALGGAVGARRDVRRGRRVERIQRQCRRRSRHERFSDGYCRGSCPGDLEEVPA